MLERRWWSWGLQGEISRLGIEVFHGTDFAVPYLPLRPSVMTLHDLSPWMDPQWHTESARIRNRTPMLLRLGFGHHGDHAFRSHPPRGDGTFSSAARSSGCGATRRWCMFHAGRQARAMGRPICYMSARSSRRKNIGLVLDLWRALRREHPIDLVLAGRRRADFPEIPAEPGLRMLGLTPEEDLPALYSGAVACLYPSYYEGFGLPVLEAMQCGAVVIASRDPAIIEVAARGCDSARRCRSRTHGWMHCGRP